MAKILVTGSTGQLGAPTAAALLSAGHDVVGVTRRGGNGSVIADLLTGAGVDAALEGIDTVVHLATTNGRGDIAIARNLGAAARRAGVGHLVLISIVGIEETPIAFYRDRVEIEAVLAASGVPLTIQRATQFHSFVDNLFSAQRWLPVVIAPAVTVQPIAVEDVAVRLAELAQGEPRGRVPDIGGPHKLTAQQLHAQWKAATGSHRPGLFVRFPGKLFAAYQRQVNLVPGKPFGRATFVDYLARKYGG